MPSKSPPQEWHQSLEMLLAAMPAEDEKQWVAAPLAHGSLTLGVYAPKGSDPQRPHGRDEVYIVMRGEGMFVNGTERIAFKAGDSLFVPAGVEHRFEAFSDDLTLWVVFYGPEGGEAP